MRQTLIYLVLALSILFNLFFGIGYLQSVSTAEVANNDETVVRDVSAALELRPEQAQKFKRLRENFTEESSVLRDDIAIVRQELADELRKGEPDVERLREIVERDEQLHQSRREARTERFHEFIEVLSPRQRDMLAQRIRRGPGGDRMKRLLQRFDANKDGRLDEKERAAAHSYSEAKKREYRERRRKRFDADGDGELNPEERENLEQWLRDNRPEGPPRRGRGGHHRDRDRDHNDDRPPRDEPEASDDLVMLLIDSFDLPTTATLFPLR